MNTLHELEKRGLISQTSADLSKILDKKRTIYIGFDPTADSLQIGNLATLLLVKRVGLLGHKLIFLVGGATGMIGDPKEKGERSLLDTATVRSNSRALKKQIKKLLGTTSFRMVDNADWLKKVSFLEFLRDIGKHFTVNELIKHDIIRRRLETQDESISYTEFTYPLLQAYDFLTLYRKYKCEVQIAGADQWTNALSGVELVRRKEACEVFAITTPLITDASGKKFGKSEGNAVWLDAKKTSPFAFYQFWLTLPDEGLETYLKVYTFLSLGEIENLMMLHQKSPSKRRAQSILAQKVTEIVHGKETSFSVEAASDALFGNVSLASLSHGARAIILQEAHTHKVTTDMTLIESIVASTLVASKSDARRLIEGKGLSLNGRVVDSDRTLVPEDFTDGLALVRKGKHGMLVLILK